MKQCRVISTKPRSRMPCSAAGPSKPVSLSRSRLPALPPSRSFFREGRGRRSDLPPRRFSVPPSALSLSLSGLRRGLQVEPNLIPKKQETPPGVTGTFTCPAHVRRSSPFPVHFWNSATCCLHELNACMGLASSSTASWHCSLHVTGLCCCGRLAFGASEEARGFCSGPAEELAISSLSLSLFRACKWGTVKSPRHHVWLGLGGVRNERRSSEGFSHKL